MNAIRRQHLEDVLVQAKINPTPLHKLLEQEENEARFVQNYLSSRNTRQETETRLESHPSQPRYIVLNTVEELQYALAYFDISTEEQDAILNHEKAHFEEALNRGLPVRFVAVIYKDSNKLGVKIATQVNLRYNTLSDKERKIALRNVVSAPSNPSNIDKQMLA